MINLAVKAARFGLNQTLLVSVRGIRVLRLSFMLTASFQLKNVRSNRQPKPRFFSFEVEKAGDFTESLDKFLKSHKIRGSQIDFFHIKLSEESSSLDVYVAQALLKAVKLASKINAFK